MPEHPPRRSFIGRLGWKTKVLIGAVLLIGVSVVIGAAFIAGVVAGITLSETGAKDRCVNGTWDVTDKLCRQTATTTPAVVSVQGEGYTCGDGSTMQIVQTTSSITVTRNNETRILPLTTSTIFSDELLTVALARPEALITDQQTDTKVACVLGSGSTSTLPVNQ